MGLVNAGTADESLRPWAERAVGASFLRVLWPSFALEEECLALRLCLRGVLRLMRVPRPGLQSTTQLHTAIPHGVVLPALVSWRIIKQRARDPG
jgi:hypothetical protein